MIENKATSKEALQPINTHFASSHIENNQHYHLTYPWMKAVFGFFVFFLNGSKAVRVPRKC